MKKEKQFRQRLLFEREGGRESEGGREREGQRERERKRERELNNFCSQMISKSDQYFIEVITF